VAIEVLPGGQWKLTQDTISSYTNIDAADWQTQLAGVATALQVKLAMPSLIADSMHSLPHTPNVENADIVVAWNCANRARGIRESRIRVGRDFMV
jgi:hypothetical protein